jgi:hypothetical protein
MTTHDHDIADGANPQLGLLLKRNHRYETAAIMAWFLVAMLATVLTFSLMSY